MRLSRSQLSTAIAAALTLSASGLSRAETAPVDGTAIEAATAVAAETTAADEQGEVKKLEAVTVVGSRRANQSAADTMVPLDVVQIDKAAAQGAQFDLGQTLQYIAPSFTSTRQTGADNADLIDAPSLRGLGSDQTLVLLNGKRYHPTALVQLFGARNRGSTGTDLNTIPMLAIDHVEVLRDGAAAQYGSDAIAGVLNVSLKKRKGCEGVLGYGQYSKGDGENYLGSVYCGVEIGNGGTLAVTGELLERGRSDRSEPGNPRIIGDTEVDNRTFFLNGDLPLGDNLTFYFNGGVQNRDASSAAFGRGGVGSDDIPSRNSAAMYPNGFVPFITGDISDRTMTGGLTGMVGEWRADFSQSYGRNELDNRIKHTLNASIAEFDRTHGGRGISPTSFDAGGFSFRQYTTNLDFTRYYDTVAQGMNVAFGGEYRRENYEIHAGEPGSYIDADGPGGGNAGSQGFPGFQPADEVDKSRHNYSIYGDVETQLTEQFKTDVAVRYEDYSDFGSTTNFKFAGGYQFNPEWLLRGSISTGFRAPSLQQRYFSSTFTDFISGEPVDVVLAPNGGAVAAAAGIPPLKEEKSHNYTLGATWKPMDNLAVTVDGYRIDIDDRIVLTGRFGNDDPQIGSILDALGVGQAQFFVNSVDTKTYGLDLTVAHNMPFWNGELTTYLAANFNRTRVDAIHVPASLAGRESDFLSDRERLFIENGAGKSKATLSFNYAQSDWESNLKIIFFGPMTLGTFSGPPVPNAHYDSKTSADLSFTYNISKDMKFTVGGANIFNVHPTAQNPDETDNGFKYESVQFGLNGAAYFARFYMKF